MSFVLSTYMNLNFDYVFLSSVRMQYKHNRDLVLKNIAAKDYALMGFALTCSEKTLTERHKGRGDDGKVSFEWMNKHHPEDFIIDTDDKTVLQIADEIKHIIACGA